MATPTQFPEKGWTFTRLIAILFSLIVVAGACFTFGANFLGWAFVACSTILFCAICLAYLNGDIRGS